VSGGLPPARRPHAPASSGLGRSEPWTFVHRVIGAAALRPAAYEDVEVDPGATAQAAAVVVLASLASGLATWGDTSIPGVVVRIVIALLSWTAWAAVIVQVGGRILPEPQTRVSLAELLRTLGFAASPGFILVFGGVPVLGPAVVLGVWAWIVVAMVVAVRQALDYQHVTRAVLVCLLGGIVAAGVTVALGLLTSSPAS
jgi:hypothetical protein